MNRLLSTLDRVGTGGSLLAAIAAPCCFPLFAGLSAAAGLGALDQFEGIVLYIFQGFVALTLVGLAAGFPRHRSIGPFLLGVLSAAALAYVFYRDASTSALYGGLGGLLLATLWNRWATRARSRGVPGRQESKLHSIVTCPECGVQTEETMPPDACWFFYECRGCHARLRPKPGDCCVFCSYGSVPCPPIQLGVQCCA